MALLNQLHNLLFGKSYLQRLLSCWPGNFVTKIFTFAISVFDSQNLVAKNTDPLEPISVHYFEETAEDRIYRYFVLDHAYIHTCTNLSLCGAANLSFVFNRKLCYFDLFRLSVLFSLCYVMHAGPCMDVCFSLAWLIWVPSL